MPGHQECAGPAGVLGNGVSLMLFSEMLKRAQAKGYTWVDLSLTSQDNPKTPALAERMGAKIYKRYRVYQKPMLNLLN
jgi:lysylphosphatidylglycerol synthetase-like protein (DUF2156 family)